MTVQLVTLLAAYLLGSIPTGLLLARAQGVDIRAAGSGNIGATNAYRTLGRTTGILTLLGDCLKGALPILVARYLGFDEAWLAAVGLAAFLGHVYTVFLGFKGGKGVATALGVFLAASPLAVLCTVGVFLAVVVTWRYVSLGSIVAAAVFPFALWLLDRRPWLTGMAGLIALLIIWKHRENLQRLRAGTESKFKA